MQNQPLSAHFIQNHRQCRLTLPLTLLRKASCTCTGTGELSAFTTCWPVSSSICSALADLQKTELAQIAFYLVHSKSSRLSHLVAIPGGFRGVGWTLLRPAVSGVRPSRDERLDCFGVANIAAAVLHLCSTHAQSHVEQDGQQKNLLCWKHSCRKGRCRTLC